MTAPPPFASHAVELAAGTLDYLDNGGPGPTLVFIHGLMMDASLWRHVATELDGEGYRCVLPTLPLGGHRRPMPDADLSLQGIVRILAEFLDQLDLRDVTLVQNDWGGAQILHALGLTARVQRMVLTSCEAFDHYPPRIARPMVQLARIPGGLALLTRLLDLHAVRRAPGGWGSMSKRPVPTEVMDAWFAPARHDPAIRRDLARYLNSVPSRDVLLAWAEAGRSFTGPVLVAWAAEDKVMPPEHGRRLAGVYPHAEHVEIPDAYTLIPEDQPGALTRLVREFLERTAAPR